MKNQKLSNLKWVKFICVLMKDGSKRFAYRYAGDINHLHFKDENIERELYYEEYIEFIAEHGFKVGEQVSHWTNPPHRILEFYQFDNCRMPRIRNSNKSKYFPKGSHVSLDDCQVIVDDPKFAHQYGHKFKYLKKGKGCIDRVNFYNLTREAQIKFLCDNKFVPVVECSGVEWNGEFSYDYDIMLAIPGGPVSYFTDTYEGQDYINGCYESDGFPENCDNDYVGALDKAIKFAFYLYSRSLLGYVIELDNI